MICGMLLKVAVVVCSNVPRICICNGCKFFTFLWITDLPKEISDGSDHCNEILYLKMVFRNISKYPKIRPGNWVIQSRAIIARDRKSWEEEGPLSTRYLVPGTGTRYSVPVPCDLLCGIVEHDIVPYTIHHVPNDIWNQSTTCYRVHETFTSTPRKRKSAFEQGNSRKDLPKGSTNASTKLFINKVVSWY